ncbi:hypothetical protein BJX99DRAFT_262591 [Aspergillus californicus]
MNIQTPPFTPLHFIPTAQKSSIMSLPVHYLAAVGHEKLPAGGNHWCFYLNTSETTSVRVDISPSYTEPSTVIPDGSKAIMIVSNLDCVVLGTALKVCRIDVAAGTRVCDFVDLLVAKGRHLYEFNGAGQGCRFWVVGQMELFMGSGLLGDAAADGDGDGGQVARAKEGVLTQWPDGMRYPLVPGEYYSGDSDK